MDYTLDQFSGQLTIAQSAINLLSTSRILEPFVPYSQHNAFYSLKFLGNLSEITQSHMENQSIFTQTSPPLANTTRLNDVSLLNALMELRNSGHSVRKPPGNFSPIIRGQTNSNPDFD